MRNLKVAVIQQRCSHDITTNQKKTKIFIRDAATAGAELILLQELHSTVYFCQAKNPDNFKLAETIPGHTTQFFSDLAKKHQIILVISLFEKQMDGLYYNTAIVLEKDGSIAGKYRKMHIPDDPGYHEKYYFAHGDLGFQPIQTSIGKLGVLICWDQWFPEAARLTALGGAEMLLYPTAIGWDKRETEKTQQQELKAWQTIQRSHAIANHLPVMVANRSGFEPDPSHETSSIHFWGNSFISGAQGEMLACTDDKTEGYLMAEFDMEKTKQLRHIWPFFRDRRTDQY